MRNWDLISGRDKSFLFSVGSKPSLGPISEVLWGVSLRVKQQRQEANSLAPSGAKVKNGGDRHQLPYSFPWCSTQLSRDNFTLSFYLVTCSLSEIYLNPEEQEFGRKQETVNPKLYSAGTSVFHTLD
jgi:hypothetical protein